MELSRIKKKSKKRINLQFFKHSWLDLKRDKIKAIFGISGIAISLLLLTTIGMLNDTVNYNYLLYVTSTTGKSDIMITHSIQTDLTFDPFYEEDIINDKLKDIEGVKELFPRISMLVTTTSNKINTSGSLQLYGIDFIKEATSGDVGDLIIVDDDGEETDENKDEADGILVKAWVDAKDFSILKFDSQ